MVSMSNTDLLRQIVEERHQRIASQIQPKRRVRAAPLGGSLDVRRVLGRAIARFRGRRLAHPGDESAAAVSGRLNSGFR